MIKSKLIAIFNGVLVRGWMAICVIEFFIGLLAIWWNQVLVMSDVIGQYAELGKPLTLLCPLSSLNVTGQLETCDWRRLNPLNKGETAFAISLIGNGTVDPTSYRAGEQYVYGGKESGDCELAVKNVTEVDLHGWECAVSWSNDSKVYTSIIAIYELATPTKPEILNKDVLRSLVDSKNFSNNTVDLKCCSNNGRPTPVLEFIYDNTTVVSEPNYADSNAPGSTCIHWNNATLNDGDVIGCVLQYRGEVLATDFEFVNVFYGPEIIGPKIPEHNEFVVSANPKPEVHANVIETSQVLSTDIVEFTIEHEQNAEYYNHWNVSWNKVDSAKLQLFAQLSNVTINISITNPYGGTTFQLVSEVNFSLPLSATKTSTTTPEPHTTTSNVSELPPIPSTMTPLTTATSKTQTPETTTSNVTENPQTTTTMTPLPTITASEYPTTQTTTSNGMEIPGTTNTMTPLTTITTSDTLTQDAISNETDIRRSTTTMTPVSTITTLETPTTETTTRSETKIPGTTMAPKPKEKTDESSSPGMSTTGVIVLTVLATIVLIVCIGLVYLLVRRRQNGIPLFRKMENGADNSGDQFPL